MDMRAKLLFFLIACSAVLSAEDVSGRWSGALTLHGPNAATQTQSVYLILNQNDTLLTGSAGKDERSQTAIRNGRVTPDGVQFEVAAVSLRLRWNGTALEGTASREDQPGMTATVSFARVGELKTEDRKYHACSMRGPTGVLGFCNSANRSRPEVYRRPKISGGMFSNPGRR